jgi:hypothetical protein
MNPVEYSLLLQKIFAILSGVCFFVITLIIGLFEPLFWPQILFFLLVLLFLFFWSLFVLLGFWWYTSIKGLILSSEGINYLVLRQGLFAVLLIFCFTSILTKALNIGLISLLFIMCLLIVLWIPIQN